MSKSEINKRYLEKLKSDPEKYAEHLRKNREANAAIRSSINADPSKRAEYLEKRKESRRQRSVASEPKRIARKQRKAEELALKKLATAADLKAKKQAYQKEWIAQLKADPEKYAEHKRKLAERMSDPERRAEYLRKQSEHNKKKLAKLKADPEKLAVAKRRAKDFAVARADELKKYSREWRAANREKLNRDKFQWAKDNPEKTVAIKRKYRQANTEKLNEYSRKKSAANPGKRNEYTRKRRAIKLNAPGSHTEAEWRALKSYYMDQCLCCGDVPDVLECDHVVPLVKGGSDDISNCQPLCRSCNGSKHVKIIDYR